MEQCLEKTRDDWKAEFMLAIERLPRGKKFTIEEIVESLGGRPVDVSSHAIGALTMQAAKKDLIERSWERPEKSKRRERRNGDCPIWKRI